MMRGRLRRTSWTSRGGRQVPPTCRSSIWPARRGRRRRPCLRADGRHHLRRRRSLESSRCCRRLRGRRRRHRLPGARRLRLRRRPVRGRRRHRLRCRRVWCRNARVALERLIRTDFSARIRLVECRYVSFGFEGALSQVAFSDKAESPPSDAALVLSSSTKTHPKPCVQRRNAVDTPSNSLISSCASVQLHSCCVYAVRGAHSRGHFGSQHKTRGVHRRALARCE